MNKVSVALIDPDWVQKNKHFKSCLLVVLHTDLTKHELFYKITVMMQLLFQCAFN